MALQGTRLQGIGRVTETVTVGEEWTTLGTYDFTAVGAADWRTSGGAVVEGVTFTAINGNKCASTFGPDGSTGIRIVQTNNGTIASNNSPGIETSLSNFGTFTDDDELCVDLRISGISAGDFGRLVAVLLDTTYISSGVMYRSSPSPGQWETGSVVSASQYTDFSNAVTDSSDFVIQVIYTASGAVIFDRGSWTGAFPTDVGGTVADAIGTFSSAARTNYKPRLSASTFRVATYKSATSATNVTIHALRIRRREKGA